MEYAKDDGGPKKMRLATDQEIAVDFDRSIAALVLNFGEYPLMHGTLGIIRSLGRLGIPVFTILRRPRLPVGASRYLAGRFLWPIDGKSPNLDEFLDGMARIGKMLDRPTPLVAGDDISAILIAEHTEDLAPQFVFVRQSGKLLRTLVNKRNLSHLCQRLGVGTFFANTFSSDP
jgi:D-aspartate ligase